jgi:hypothetical protein
MRANIAKLMDEVRRMRSALAREGPLLIAVAGSPDRLTEDDGLVGGALYRRNEGEDLERFHARLVVA